MKAKRDDIWTSDYPKEEGLYWLADCRDGGRRVALACARKTEDGIRLFRRDGAELDAGPEACGQLPPDMEVSRRIGSEEDGPSAQILEAPAHD